MKDVFLPLLIFGEFIFLRKKLDKGYDIYKIIDAQLVICPDEDKQVGEFGGLKSLTSGDDVSYRPIFPLPWLESAKTHLS